MQLINTTINDNSLVDFIQSHYINSLYYDKQLLNFALDCTGKQYIIKLVTNNIIIGCITGIVHSISESRSCVVVNFLCIHKDYRSYGIVHVLRNELFKQAILDNVSFAIFTCSSDTTFSDSLPQNKQLVKSNAFNTLYNASYYHLKTKIQQNFQIPSTQLRPLTSNQIPQITQLLNNTYKDALAPVFTNNFVSRHFYNNPVCKSFVISQNAIVSDFVSYFLIKHTCNNIVINTAHLYYYAGNLDLLLEQLLPLLINDINIDQLICLDVMDNKTILSKFGFIRGTGKLTYYSFQSDSSSTETNIHSSQIGIIPI